MDGAAYLHTGDDATWVDNAAHWLHHHGRSYPCSREIEALALWRGQPLLLSSDTDCLSLWDTEGPVRLARAGAYPQDMAICGDCAYVCGGADGRLHALSLPELRLLRTFSLPGMPERIALHGQTAFVLTLLTEPDVHTALLQVDLRRNAQQLLARYEGLPGALHAHHGGLWIAAGGKLLHQSLPTGDTCTTVEGFGLIRRLVPHGGGVVAIDTLEERLTWLSDAPSPRIIPLPAPPGAFSLLGA